MPKIYQSLYKSAEQYNLHFIGIVLNVVNLTFLDFQMASLLQLLFSPLNDFMLIFNLILSIICQILIIAIILYYWKRLNQSEDTLKHQIYKQRFGLLYEQFKIRKNYSQYYMLIVTIKKILFMNLLILFFFYPFVQSLSLLFICLNDILFLLYDFPFVSIKDSIGTMMIEQTLFLTIIGSTLLAY